MFAAVIFMLTGITVVACGIYLHNQITAWTGFVMIVSTCISWWFWVMFVIREMINHTDRTVKGINHIRQDIQEVRNIIESDDFFLKR